MGNSFEDLDLDRLRRRRSQKWQMHPPDVLPAFIAEMDYDLAEPVLAALRSAVDLSDCGYANPAGLGEVFARFAAARHGWAVDPGRVHLRRGDLARLRGRYSSRAKQPARWSLTMPQACMVA
jgi:bifunctional pyridoxal-dependent enzyme with beta-cystathionase and maltose regulon repressor activities